MNRTTKNEVVRTTKDGKTVICYSVNEYIGFSEEELDILEAIDKENALEVAGFFNGHEDLVDSVMDSIKEFKEGKL